MDPSLVSRWRVALALALLLGVFACPIFAASAPPGPLNRLTLQLQGLASARDRAEFETKLLLADPAIAEFNLTRLSAEASEYQILTHKPAQAQAQSLLTNHPSFVFEVVALSENLAQ